MTIFDIMKRERIRGFMDKDVILTCQTGKYDDTLEYLTGNVLSMGKKYLTLTGIAGGNVKTLRVMIDRIIKIEDSERKTGRPIIISKLPLSARSISHES